MKFWLVIVIFFFSRCWKINVWNCIILCFKIYFLFFFKAETALRLFPTFLLSLELKNSWYTILKNQGAFKKALQGNVRLRLHGWDVFALCFSFENIIFDPKGRVMRSLKNIPFRRVVFLTPTTPSTPHKGCKSFDMSKIPWRKLPNHAWLFLLYM